MAEGDYERYQARRRALEDIRNIVDGLSATGGQGEHVLVLSSYELANLTAALEAGATVVRGPNPLGALNNGDWLNQVRFRLPSTDTAPNAEPMALIDAALQRSRLS